MSKVGPLTIKKDIRFSCSGLSLKSHGFGDILFMSLMGDILGRDRDFSYVTSMGGYRIPVCVFFVTVLHIPI